MAKAVIGIIFTGPLLGADEKIFKKLAKRNNVELVLLDILEGVVIEDIYEKIKRCDIIYNNSAEEFAIEFEKTLEELGKKVIDPTKYYDYSEDKWMFYLKCIKNNIPVPDTILLSEKIDVAKKELKDFDYWPVILKRIEGTCGEYVEKAENIRETENIIKKFWKRGSQRLPIIAQEYISSPCYRITVIDGKIVQAIVKDNNQWKKTGVYAKRFKRLNVDGVLKKLVEKVNQIMKIKICGIDFLKKEEQWIALEVNSAPAFDFFESEREKIVSEVLNFLLKEVKSKS